MADKLPGTVLVARVAALEGFVKILIHDMLKRDPTNAATVLDAMSKASREQAASWPENKDLKVHNIIHTDDFLEAVRNELTQGATK